jgi:hypothetical protein
MRLIAARSLKILLVAGIATFGLVCSAEYGLASSTSPIATPATQTPSVTGGGIYPPPVFRVAHILLGASLHHTFVPAGSATTRSETLSDPDDISQLGPDLFVGFQNGVGPQGQPSTDGNRDSTIVEMSLTGEWIGQWDVVGKADGVTADPDLGAVIATVNEDANSALYTIRPNVKPTADAVTRYSYSEPLPHYGGTDAISIYNGHLFVSASAPGTTGAPAPQASYPAVYSVFLNPYSRVATVQALFYDEDSATIANVNGSTLGESAKLGLTDPDSNEVVPIDGPRFAGDFMLTSQGDLEQIYVSDPGSPHQRLAVLSLTQAVDDTAWATAAFGRLYSTDSVNDAVDVITGSFRSDQPLVAATPCGANSAPAICPAPPKYPGNYLATMNPWTGLVTAVRTVGAPYVPQGGLAFVPGYYW